MDNQNQRHSFRMMGVVTICALLLGMVGLASAQPLTSAIQRPQQATPEPTPMPLQFGKEATAKLSALPEFSFEGKKGQRVTITVSYKGDLPEGGGYAVELSSSCCDELGGLGFADLESVTLTLKLPDDGTFFVRISAYTGTEEGTVTLKVEEAKPVPK